MFRLPVEESEDAADAVDGGIAVVVDLREDEAERVADLFLLGSSVSVAVGGLDGIVATIVLDGTENVTEDFCLATHFPSDSGSESFEKIIIIKLV